jgi:hypothetical protein
MEIAIKKISRKMTHNLSRIPRRNFSLSFFISHFLIASSSSSDDDQLEKEM